MNDEIKPGYDRVSDVASAFGNHGKIPKNILDYAADRGTLIHELIYDLMNDVFVKEERYLFCGKSIQGYIDSFWKFWKPYEGNFVLSQEKRYYHEKDLITGQIDLLVNINNEPVLIDWKATSAVGKHWEIQAAGYFRLSGVNRALFVRLDKDGNFPEVTEYGPNDYLFGTALDMYRMFFKDQKSNLEME